MHSKVFGKRKAKSSTKAKAKAQRQRQKHAQRQRERKKQGQVEGRNIRHVEHEMLLLQRKGSSQVLEMASAEKKTMSHELCKLTMIHSDASVHVCPLKHGQGDSPRKSSETRPLPGAEVQQREMRQMNCDSEAGRVTAVHCVLDMGRSIWSLRSMLDSSCDVYFPKDRCWIAKDNGKELDVIFRGGVFFVATKLSKPSSKKRSVLELDSMSQAEVERATSTRMHAGFGVSDSAVRDTLDGGEPSVRIRIPTGLVTPSAEEKKLNNASGHALLRRRCRWRAAARTADEPYWRKQQPETDEAASRVEFDFAELEREEDQTSSTSFLNAFDDGSESSTATVCSTKAFREYLTETTVAFVEVLGHTVVMLH